MRTLVTTIGMAVGVLLLAGSAWAEVSFFSDSRGNSGTIITPGGPEGAISFYHDTFGNTGTLITPGGSQGGITFYEFSHPQGDITSGTIQSFGRAPSPAPVPPVFVPAPPSVPFAPIAPVTPKPGSGILGGGEWGSWRAR